MVLVPLLKINFSVVSQLSGAPLFLGITDFAGYDETPVNPTINIDQLPKQNIDGSLQYGFDMAMTRRE